MTKRLPIIIASLLLVSVANAVPTAQKNSLQFNYRYEALADVPPVENAGEWEVWTTEPNVLGFTSGIMQLDVSGNQIWMLTTTTLAQLNHSSGWTFETRLKVVSQSGTRGAIALTIDDRDGDSGGRNGFQIHAGQTQWSTDGAVADSSDNTDRFHTFRLSEEPNSDLIHGWRDGVYLGSASDGGDFTQAELKKYMLFGSWSGQINGLLDIDYVRWDSTGAFAPQPLMDIQETAGATEVSENGATSDTFEFALLQAPTTNVLVTIQPLSSDVDLGGGPGVAMQEIFTPGNFSTSRTVVVTAVDDILQEGPHQADIDLAASSTDPVFNGISRIVTVQIQDNDIVMALTESNGSTEVNEALVTSDQYYISLFQQPTADVFVTVASPTSQLTLGVAGITTRNLQFTTGDWSTSQSIQVNAVDNAVWDNVQIHTLTHSISSADPRFNNFPLPDVSIQIFGENENNHNLPNGYTIPLIDLDRPEFQVITDIESGVYLGHPTTVLLHDQQTILATYPRGGHARGECVLKRSLDGGITWGSREGAPGVPPDWISPGIQEVPCIFELKKSGGGYRLVNFTGLYPCRMSYSEDDGNTWTPFNSVGNWGGIVTMGCLTELKDGRYIAMFHDDGRFFQSGGSRDGLWRLYKTYSSDGGLNWTFPEEIIYVRGNDGPHVAEPGIFRFS